MNVWVNVWRWTRSVSLVALSALSASVSGCIDDFDDPEGYGAAGGPRSVPTRQGCFRLCEQSVVCGATDELSCKRECPVLEAEAEAAGCSEEFADLVECALTLEDVCSPEDGCQAQVERFLNCTYI